MKGIKFCGNDSSQWKIIIILLLNFLEKKRRVYDQYGKEGLQMPGNKGRYGDDFDPHFAGTFVFRDPEEVFREFFDGAPFEDLFAGKTRMRTRNALQ